MLTLKQKLEDLDYFWHILDTCFPVKGPAAQLGYDWEAIRARSYETVKNTADDLEFFRAMEGVVREFKEEGRERFLCHLRIFEPSRYFAYRKMFGIIAGSEDESYKKAQQPWVDALYQPQSEEFYAQFEERAAGIHLKAQAPELLPEGYDPVFRRAEGDENCSFKILEEGKTAYIFVKSLNTALVNSDRPKIFAFMEKLKGYKHLIIDFRENGGGDTRYWQKLLVAPTAKREHSVRAYMGVSLCPENINFFAGKKLLPITSLPADELPKLNKSHLEGLTNYMEAFYHVSPDPEHHYFDGKVWVLVSKTVYSSAEAFAVFSKNSGWATVIGESTGGDGISVTPLHYCMPNSGIVWRLKGVYGINPDGSSNQVYGTTPHIVCDPEKALEVCLAEIAKEA